MCCFSSMAKAVVDLQLQHCLKLCDTMFSCVQNELFCDTIIHTKTDPVYAHAVVLSNVSQEMLLLVNELKGVPIILYLVPYVF